MSAWRERLVSAEVRARLAELVESDAEVRLLNLWLGEPKIFEWALSIGTLRDPRLRALAPPLPAEALRRITAEETPEAFLWTGLVDVEALLGLYERHRGPGGRARPRLLDFGCGCGRLLRFLTRHADLCELYGSDVNAEHVVWCRANLAPIEFSVNGAWPPLPYADGFFDGLWSLSVFTHLDQTQAEAWRAELARVLAPGAVLVATMHGPVALAKLARDRALAARFRFDAERIAALTREVARTGFAFVPYEGEALSAAKAGEVYGSSFASPEFVAARWTGPDFTLAAHLPGALRGWQDVVVLKRSP